MPSAASGFCAPTIIVLVLAIIGIIFQIYEVAIKPQKGMHTLVLILSLICCAIVVWGFHTLCSCRREDWAWGIIGLKILAGITTAISISLQSCKIGEMCEGSMEMN